MRSDSLVLYLGGEVCVSRESPESIFAGIRPHFDQADIRFFHQEAIYSTRGVPTTSPGARFHRAHPQNAEALQAMRFDVASFASNVALDFGSDAFLETIEVLRKAGIEVAGAGKDISEARLPVVIERKGTSVAFLAYTCLLDPTYRATTTQPGVVPLRMVTAYETQLPSHPGSLPRIRTLPDPGDLRLLLADVRNTAAAYDVVVVAMHWGLHAPLAMPEYQSEVGRMIIDTGADLVLGTGTHAIKPIEVHQGKVIFHGIGNLAFDFGTNAGVDLSDIPYAALGWDTETWSGDYSFPHHTRHALVAKCLISEGDLIHVSFVPISIDKHAVPRWLSTDEVEFDEVVSYAKAVCEANGVNTTFVVRENEVLVQCGSRLQ